MTEETSTPTTHRKLTPAEWEQVVVLWESGSVTLNDLETRFGISRTALHEGLKKRGSVKGSRAKEFATHTEEALKSEATRKAEAIKGFKHKFGAYGDFIMDATMKELQSLGVGKDPATRSAEVNRRIFTSLKYGAEIFKIVRDEKYHLLDLYDQRDQEADLPEIGVVEYSDDEINAIKRRFDTVPLMEDDDSILEEARAALEALETTGD